MALIGLRPYSHSITLKNRNQREQHVHGSSEEDDERGDREAVDDIQQRQLEKDHKIRSKNEVPSAGSDLLSY